MPNPNTKKYVIASLLGVALFVFLYLIMEVVTFYTFPRMIGSVLLALVGGGAIGSLLQRLPDEDEKSLNKYYVICFSVMAVIAFLYVTLVGY